MQHPRQTASFPLLALALACALALSSRPLAAANFNYHGQLLDGDAPASGRYDLRIRTFAQADAKAALGAAVELPNVYVIDGSFAVELDLPESKIGDTFVEVEVRKAGSGDAFEVLGTAQKIAKANTGCWALDGNTGLPGGSFLGNADPASTAPLVLRAKNTPIATLTPRGTSAFYGDAPSVAFGSAANNATGIGAVVGGGGATRFADGIVCPDCFNSAQGEFSTIAGGNGNLVTGGHAVASGGLRNEAAGSFSVVAGGVANQADNSEAVVGGGRENHGIGSGSVVPGGYYNCAGGDFSFAAGRSARARSGNELSDSPCPGSVPNSGDADGDEGTFVWADAQAPAFASTGPNQFLVRAGGGMGLNTATMGAATNLRSGEIVVKNSTSDPNTDITLLNITNRGFGLVSEPGTSGNAGRFYITEVDARASGVLFNPLLRINVDGTTSVVGGSVTNISDARVKKNIADIDQPLDTLLALRGHTFEYIDPAASMNPPGTRIGFIAQEVREVLPQWISDVGGGHLGVQTSGFEALAVEAIRDLKVASDARIETLEQDNAALRAQLADILARLGKIEARRGE